MNRTLTHQILLALTSVAACAPVDDVTAASADAIQLPRPNPCTPGVNCLMSAPTQVGAACPPRVDQCLGAVGSNCQGAVVPGPWSLYRQVGCTGSTCWVNAGSWLHDECCVDHRSGFMCDGAASLASSTCAGEMAVAVHRLQHNLGWQRVVNTCRVDADGEVDFGEYCAPAGTILAREDEIRCCSGRARRFDYVRDMSAALARLHPVQFDGSYDPVVCLEPARSTPPAASGSTPRPAARACRSEANCASDEVCIVQQGQGVCVAY